VTVVPDVSKDYTLEPGGSQAKFKKATGRRYNHLDFDSKPREDLTGIKDISGYAL
jgi:hypothetical protein